MKAGLTPRRWISASKGQLVRLDPYLVIGTIIALTALAVACRLHSIYLRDPGPIGFDDGYTMAIGERLIDGQWLPYVDGCSHRGPMLYWAAAIAQALSGRYGWMGTRWLTVVLTVGTLLGIYFTGVAARRPFAGAVAALIYTWTAMVAFDTAFKITGEAVASLFSVAAMLFTVLALFRADRRCPRVLLLVAAGAAAALAGLSKQTSLPTIGPLGLWVIAAAWSRDEWSRRDRWQMVGALAAGFAFPLLATLARYAVVGELHTFWYWYYRYNAEIYMHPFKDVPFLRQFNAFLRHETWSIGALVISSAWGVAYPFSQMRGGGGGIARGYATGGFEATSAWMALLMFAAAVAPMRNWAHYFLTVLPFMGLLVGAQGEMLLRGEGSAPFRVAAFAVAAAALLGFFLQISVVRIVDVDAAKPKEATTMTPEPLCDVITTHSGPKDGVFIWGFDGDLYLTCGRRPATRFTYLTLVAGNVPPAWNEPRDDRAALGSRQQLLDDLRKERPPIILDMPASMGNVSMRAIPVLRTFLEKEYCQLPEAASRSGRKAGVWLRRDLPACRR